MPSTSQSLMRIEIYQYDLYVISCHPNFWLPFTFIHADKRSTKLCNKFVVASLNQRQERFMHYYLKNRLLLFTNMPTTARDWLWLADRKNEEECGLFYTLVDNLARCYGISKCLVSIYLFEFTCWLQFSNKNSSNLKWQYYYTQIGSWNNKMNLSISFQPREWSQLIIWPISLCAHKSW
jgi:hypothetical protein